MGYAETIAECCRYIDRNFQKELSAIELAEKYHYSYYHFCRIFQVIKDISVAEYIRCRRMEAAIDRIYGGAGMLEAALDVGFETPEIRMYAYGIFSILQRRGGPFYDRTKNRRAPAIFCTWT